MVYDYKIDVSNENSSHTKILRLVGRDKSVLEIGCATGYMTRYLKEELGCRVFCVEIDPESAEKARPYCDGMAVGDIEALDLEAILGARRFDVVIMADVVEHLKDAGKVLVKLRGFLGTDGFLLLSIPNGTHGSMALEILDGKWQYRNEGLLDSTHLHFFDRESLAVLLDGSGFLYSRLERIIVHPRDTEMKTPWDSYPRDVTAYLEKVNPEFQTYQFIVKAFPTTERGWRIGIEDVQKGEKEKAAHLEEALRKAQEKLASLKGFDDELKKREREYLEGLDREMKRLEAEKVEIHEHYKAHIARLEEEKLGIHEHYRSEMRGYQGEIKNLQLEAGHFKLEHLQAKEHLDRTRQENDRLKQVVAATGDRLQDIEGSLSWRMILAYRHVVERLLPPGTRRRRFYGLCLLSPRVLFREGPGTFFKRILTHMHVIRSDGLPGHPGDEEGKRRRPLSFPQHREIEVSIIIPVFNQAQLTFRCLESILAHTHLPYEVLVVDNASDEETVHMLGLVEGMHRIRNGENKGFVTACNQGAEKASGKNLLFLNNDTQVTEGWLESLLKPMENQKVGVVGAKLVYPDGRLQEAGNIIWQDGTGWNYGRGDDPDLPEYNYVREVDYCSGACLLIRKKLWEELGGLDTRYAPAYYEDTDLCFSARNKGYKVIYQPEARVIHWEGASSGTDPEKGYKRYQKINLEKFGEKWRTTLQRDHFEGPDSLYLARERAPEKRVLVVDHYAPTFDMDSGSLRMFTLLKIMAELGCKVIFWPENRAYHERYTKALQRLGVEALYGNVDFEEYLRKNGMHLDVVILSRPHVAVHFIYAVKKLTKARVLYDTVDLHFLREERRARIEAGEASRQWKDMELYLAHQADDVLVVSDVEKEILEKEALGGKISVISNIHNIEKAYRPFDQRDGLLFIGGFDHLPNRDGIIWFVNSILPIIHKRLPDVSLSIVGSRPTEEVKALASKDVIVTGYVEDVQPFFETSRIFVCPLRYGAGVKGKIGQSMAYGLPVVTTSIGAEGFGMTDGCEALIADDENGFADKVIELYQDRNLWEKLSLCGMELIEKKYSPGAAKEALRKLLCVGKDPA